MNIDLQMDCVCYCYLRKSVRSVQRRKCLTVKVIDFSKKCNTGIVVQTWGMPLQVHSFFVSRLTPFVPTTAMDG